MIYYTLKQIMFQLHNSAYKMNGDKMLLSYIKNDNKSKLLS